VGIGALISAADPADHARRRLMTRLEPAGLPSTAHVLALLCGLALLMLAPRIMRGTRAAVPLALVALGVVSLLSIGRPFGFVAAAVALCLAVALAFGKRAFPLGSHNRPRPALVFAASGAWALAFLSVLAIPLLRDHGRGIRRAVHHAIGHVLHVSLQAPAISGVWLRVVEVLIACAGTTSLLALRSMLRPAADRSGHSQDEHDAARYLVDRHGEDSLSRFILRSDKSFHFDGDGVLAYRLIGETAVVSGDPVAPADGCRRLLESFAELARDRGWEVVVWGASPRYLELYRIAGMHPVLAGEEAVVDPSTFTLEGRAVRKLRQSVHRMRRRGWQLEVREARELESALAAELDQLETQWLSHKRRVLGFAMGMGPFDAQPSPDDLYAIGRSPDGSLGAAIRFVSHRGKLSLDATHRLPGTPNGLTEALVCQVLAAARERGIPEVSLNYAGLGHLARTTGGEGRLRTAVNKLLLKALGRRFQLDRLVRFNEKFSPQWRPRYLVCESRAALPRAVLRVLQVEGYLPERRPASLRLARRLRPLPQRLRPDAVR
jgi:lysyl-tRNA synthetase class 2